VLALRHFAAEQCDLVIWETGMGGRLDATNIVTPLASVITNIAFDHQQWLGHTLTAIATEKAGIVKPGVPVLTGTDAPEAIAVIRDTARQAGSTLIEVPAADALRPPCSTVDLPLLGAHQRRNAALALATVRALSDSLPVSAAAMDEGLRTVRWAGRLQVLKDADGRINLIDGAHNPAGVQALADALALHFPGQKPAMILGVLADKDWKTMCDGLLPLAQSVCLVPVASSRTATPEELRTTCAARHPTVPLNLCHSLAEALRLTQNEPFRLLAGSLYLVGEALELLGAAPSTGADERRLNEWQGSR